MKIHPFPRLRRWIDRHALDLGLYLALLVIGICSAVAVATALEMAFAQSRETARLREPLVIRDPRP